MLYIGLKQDKGDIWMKFYIQAAMLTSTSFLQ